MRPSGHDVLPPVLDALEAILDASPFRQPRRQSATAGALCAAPDAARERLGAALRDAGYPDAMRSPQALGMALRQLGRAGQADTRRLARTGGGRWFVRYGYAVAA